MLQMIWPCRSPRASAEAAVRHQGFGVQIAKLYQRYATRCLREARTASDSKHKAFLVEMAQAWQRLADQAKVMGATPTSSSEPDRGDWQSLPEGWPAFEAAWMVPPRVVAWGTPGERFAFAGGAGLKIFRARLAVSWPRTPGRSLIFCLIISPCCALHKICQSYSMARMALPDDRPCARCGFVMPLIRTFPRLGMVPEMHVFVCNSCGEVRVEEVPQQAVGATAT